MDKSARGKKFRFRHRQFQLYLYARHKVDTAGADEDLFQDTLEDLDEDINKDVIKWMFAIYTDREEELPDDLEGSLQILDEDGLGFYWASKILDVVKKWDADDISSIAETVLEKLEYREDLYKYFFDDETDPSWARALAATDRFHNPPRHLLGYLYEAASVHPETVGQILQEDVGGLDRNEKAIAVSIIQQLPLEYGAKLYGIAKEGLEDTEFRLDMCYARSAELTEDLVNGEYFDEALELIDLLLTIRLEAEPEGSNEDIMGSYYLTSLFEGGTLKRLIENRPDSSLKVFEEKLRYAAKLNAEKKGLDIDDLSFFYRYSVSNYSIGESDRIQLFELFVGFLREAVDLWFKVRDVVTQREKIEEYINENVILRAFGFYLLREHSRSHRDLVAKQLLDEQNYGDHRLKKEFNLLLKNGFQSLTEAEQEDVEKLITSVPIRESFVQIAKDREEEFDEMSIEEIVEQYANRWVRDRLWPIREELSKETSERFSELLDRFEDEPEDPEAPPVRGGFVSYESPESEENLRNRSPEELINFCIEEPFEEHESYTSDSVERRGRMGAAEKVADLILDSPKHYAFEIPRRDILKSCGLEVK